MKRAMLIVAAFWMVCAATAWPMDQIKTSTAEKVYRGKIIGMSATAISFEGKDAPNEITVNEITFIIFENSPESLTTAQRDMIHGDYEKAIDALKKEITEDKRPEVADEIKYCRAFCTAQLALAGAADADPVDAAKMLFKFIADSPNNFHNLKACELMGDLCVTVGKFADAQKYYAKLSAAPWADYKIRAQVALGRSYLAQGNAAAADKAFEEALTLNASGDLAEIQRTGARIGKARCLVLGGKVDQALRTLNEILDRAEDNTPEVNAMAYNAKGTALRKAKKPQDAIIAFLHVHLLYSTLPDLDAEAVANLAQLFHDTHKPGHEHDMREILGDKYKNSRWAQGVK